ncbi:hypothetical protein K9L05_03760 [Candidatus Babeliales bacterium]|nr:hypothetical protein [Candidatus Babeliales bacterium]MCF7899734.1 hypothetical protein [Candidatus Babeliales bacterium]
MQIIFYQWIRSLQILAPKNFGDFFRRFCNRLYYGTKNFLAFFGWLFIFYSFFFLIFGDLILKGSSVKVDSLNTGNVTVLLINFFLSIIWFFLSIGFLLSIRRGDGFVDFYYFKIGFLRYIQLWFMLSLILFFIIYFFLSFGITVFPTAHWSVGLFIKISELIIAFCWLDSNYSFKDLFFTIEKSLNIILYNLAFLFIIFAFWVLFSWGFLELEKNIISAGTFDFLASLKVLLVKYSNLFVDYMIIVALFTFYSIKKNENYTHSFFEKKDE